MESELATAPDIPIIYEDESLIIINKPAGLVVNRSHTYSGCTLQDWIEKRLGLPPAPLIRTQRSSPTDYGTPEEIFSQRSGIVHRLDKDTSGVMVLAKNAKTLSELLRQFKERETQKTYIALVHGKLVPAQGSVNLPMSRSLQDRKKFAVSADGKLSETEYSLVEFFPGLPKGISPKKGKSYQGFSLVELSPKTGRTHQIRVHMAAIHHPLVSDETYAGKKRIGLDLEWCPRQFLHARRLCLTHPTSQERMCFEADLSEDLAFVLRKFIPQEE